MGSFSIVTFSLLAFATCVMYSDAQDFDNISASPMLPTPNDIKKCKEIANGRIYKETKKILHETCRPECVFENGDKDRVVSEDKTPCCDMGGAVATGLCKNGSCMAGGKFDINPKKILGIFG